MNHATSIPEALRKAAIVVATLDAPSAEALLEKMPSATAEQVRQLAAGLIVPDTERERVLREFVQAGGLGRESEALDGVELDPALADKLHAPRGYDEFPTASRGPAGDSRFEFLREVATESLFQHLERQHPQLIAVVTAHLPPARAADLIKRFSPRLQADLLRRVAELDELEPEVLADLSGELQAMLSQDLRLARNRHAGLATISSILNAAGSDRRALFDSLSRYGGELATHLAGEVPRSRSPAPAAADSHRPAPPRGATASATPSLSAPAATPASGEAPATDSPLPQQERLDFEELALLSDQDWAVLLREVEQPIVLLALTGASEILLQRITSRLSRREAQRFRDRLQRPGPLRLSDIEHAQRYLAECASRLIAQGQLGRPQRRGFAAAA